MISLTKTRNESFTTTDPRVSVFIPSLDGLGGGGAEQVLLYLAQGFSEKGFKVDLVLLKAVGVFMSKIPPGVQVIDLEVDTEKSFLTLRKLFSLIRYLRKEQPAALFAISDTDNIAMWAKRLTGVSTQVITVLQVPFSVPLKWINSSLKRLLVLNSYRWVDGIIACSQGVANDFVSTTNLASKKVTVIFNPVDITKVLIKAQEPVQHPWFAPDAPPIILGVGRLAKQKDFSTLIQAFSLVRQQRQAKLIILGEGDQRSELEALICKLDLEADVELAGFQMNPYAYMTKAKLFVLSSIFEG
jgi:glycosyltransferase involved in cell wall biosynthesis